MSKYRFKTEEEFKRDGSWNGHGYGHPNMWASSGNMNKYLGQDIPDSYNTICDKYEGFIYETWSFLPSEYVLKETAFVLPSKWCVKVDRNCQPEEVYKWRKMSWVDAGYINNSTTWTDVVLHNYTEITLEQFKQHVLKESPVVESPKAIDMKEIQEEAKKRFPIGCKFIPVDWDETYTLYTLIEDNCTYKILGTQIWAQSMCGSLYNNGKWATLVSLPEIKKEMFHQGDYIVTLDVEDGYNCAKRNYCFKQRVNNKGIYPAVDLRGSTGNGHGAMSFDKKEYLKDWRYATPEEAAEYERIRKPYDVTTLQKKEESIPEYVECIEVPTGWSITKKGVIYKIDSFDSANGYFILKFDKGGQRVTSEKHCFKPSTKEAYEAQNTPKKLTKEDLVEGEIYFYDNKHIVIYPEGPVLYHGKDYEFNVNWMWMLSIAHATEEQKALLRSYMKKDEKQEWSEGTYVVGIKGGFGVFSEEREPVGLGKIYTIKENRLTNVVVKESPYWVYKENLRWFATHQEALTFSNQLKTTPPSKESDTSELTPLEICKQKYRKGMRVMSADNSGMFTGEFIIEVDPDKFTKTGSGVDYQNSKGWLYAVGKYAEILEDNVCEISSHEPFIKEVVKTQPNEELIKPIYSVNIDLVVKNKKNKIIF